MPAYLGIDFGTSNTHVAFCNDAGAGQLVAVPIKIAGRSSNTSSVLWRTREGEEEIEAFGTVATDAWSQFDSAERTNRRLALGFKPDIAVSPAARADATAFLRKICEAVSAIQPAAVRDGLTVIGAPAQVASEQREITRQIARAAGFAKADCVEEPLGALAYHLTNGSLTLAEAREGVVVIDFGGGTLDLALVNAERGLRTPWGDPALGGRLFDDLFYRWVQDRSGGFEVSEREAMGIWQKECREMKEAFSRRWAMVGDGMADFTYRIDCGERMQTLKNASVAEFLERARAYRPSPVALAYFQRFGLPAPLQEGRSVDLLDWIRRTMERGAPREGKRFSKVILTGGSSDWPFMTRLAAEVFDIDPAAGVIRSEDPETTIGSGLALYNALRERFKKQRAAVEAARPRARDEIAVAVSELIEEVGGRLAAEIVDTVMPRIDDLFGAWYRKGGSLRRVGEEVEAACADCEPENLRLAEAERDALMSGLARLFREHLAGFMQAHEITKDVSRYVPDAGLLLALASPGADTEKMIASEIGETAGTMAAVAASVGPLVAATVHAKLIILLAIAHPLLAALAGVGSLAAYLGIGRTVGAAVQDAVKDHEFNALTLGILHITLSEAGLAKKLAEGRRAAEADLRRAIVESLKGDKEADAPGLVERAAAAYDAMLGSVVADLGVLERGSTSIRPNALIEL